MIPQMKQRVFTAAGLLLVLGLFAASCGMGPADAQDPPCSNVTLKGNYGFTITGQILGGPAMGLVTGLAMTTFNGDGTLDQVDHILHNGAPPTDGWRSAKGSYNVNPDCTGTMDLTNFSDGSPDLHLYIVVDQTGKEVRTVVDHIDDLPGAPPDGPGPVITSIGVKTE